MTIGQSFRLSLKSIWAKKGRSFLTMLGIIIGVAAVMILVSLVQGYTSSLKELYSSMGENKVSVYFYKWSYNSAGENQKLGEELYDYCLTLDDYVEGVTPTASTWAESITYQTNRLTDYSIVYFGSDQYTTCQNYTIAKGRDFSYIDIKNKNKVCLIGSYAAELLFNYSNPVGKHIQVNGTSFEVIGVYEQKYSESGNAYWYHMYYDSVVVVPYTTTRYLNPSMELTDFTVAVKDKESVTKVVSYIGGWFEGKITADNGYYQVYDQNQSMDYLNEETSMLSAILGGIAAISLLVGGIGIMNIMLVTVTERTREIGIRKAIGAERRAIVMQFLIEASVLSFLGGVLGILLGFLGTLVGGKLMFDLTLLPTVGITLSAAGISVLIGVIFGAFPAYRASGLQPVEALRAE